MKLIDEIFNTRDLVRLRDLNNTRPEYLNGPWLHGHRPLHAAANADIYEFVKFLLENGCNPNERVTIKSPVSGRVDRGFPALFFAKSPSVMQLLVQYGADVNVESDDGESFFLRLCNRRDVELLRMFFQVGGNPTNDEIDEAKNWLKNELSIIEKYAKGTKYKDLTSMLEIIDEHCNLKQL